MQRVLDIDLDFFVEPVVHWPPDERPSADEHYVWTQEQAERFLREQCHLDYPKPGFVTETHDELFPLWRGAVECGELRPPFHVTHVDAHADLGLGENGWVYLETDLLWEEPEARTFPKTGYGGMNEANFLAFAIACRWIADLEYVFCPGGGDDVFPHYWAGFEHGSDHLQLPVVAKATYEASKFDVGAPRPDHLEPPVPFRLTRVEDYQAPEGFDLICITRSPRYTPPSADALFDFIRARFILDG